MNKILIIPDSFKGTMSSREVGRILEEEARACWPEAEVTRVEVADGGEGTVDAFLAVLPGEKRRCRVHGPFGEWVDAAYGRIGETAVIEMAAAAGLPLAAGRPGAGQASTYGVGELLADAVAHGARRIVLGLGGSATNDGGAGAAAALGVRFYRANGEVFVPVGDTLAEIARIDAAPARQALRGVTVTAICDIDNPLCGPQGAAAVFAPQKGAAPADLPRLDAGLRHLAEVAGPEAGLGAGAAAFFGARLQSGIETVLDTVGFDRMLEGCSLVLTGEGRIDGQSARGKVVAGVAARAKAKGVPVVVIAGDIGEGAEQLLGQGVCAMFSINRVAQPFSVLRRRAPQDLRATAANLFRYARLAETLPR